MRVCRVCVYNIKHYTGEIILVCVCLCAHFIARLRLNLYYTHESIIMDGFRIVA